MILADLHAEFAFAGLCTRGAFHPLPADQVPGGSAAGTLVLIGNVGGTMWEAFETAVDPRRRDMSEHPLDTWTRSVVEPIAAASSAKPIYPFEGPPYHPFQRWARRAWPGHESPIGPLIDAQVGLWHALRAALVFRERWLLPPRIERPSPCDRCSDRPCLTTCPVDAIRRNRYNVAACVAHVCSSRGTDCRMEGCRARRACPIGEAYRYPSEQAEFHMAKFLAAQIRDATE